MKISFEELKKMLTEYGFKNLTKVYEDVGESVRYEKWTMDSILRSNVADLTIFYKDGFEKEDVYFRVNFPHLNAHGRFDFSSYEWFKFYSHIAYNIDYFNKLLNDNGYYFANPYFGKSGELMYDVLERKSDAVYPYAGHMVVELSRDVFPRFHFTTSIDNGFNDIYDFIDKLNEKRI